MQGHARYRHGVLKREEHAHLGADVGVFFGNVFAFEYDAAAENLAVGTSHQGVRECALARPVGPHHGVYLASAHGQVHACKDFLFGAGDLKVLYLEQVAVRVFHSRSQKAFW